MSKLNFEDAKNNLIKNADSIEYKIIKDEEAVRQKVEDAFLSKIKKISTSISGGITIPKKPKGIGYTLRKNWGSNAIPRYNIGRAEIFEFIYKKILDKIDSGENINIEQELDNADKKIEEINNQYRELEEKIKQEQINYNKESNKEIMQEKIDNVEEEFNKKDMEIKNSLGIDQESKEEPSQKLESLNFTESLEKYPVENAEQISNNKIEEDYTTIGYADVILNGKLEKKFISDSPREDTVYEILKDKNGNIKLGVWKGAEKRVLNCPDFVDGCDKQKVASKPNRIDVKLGDLQKNDEGGYVVTTIPSIKFTDKPQEEVKQPEIQKTPEVSDPMVIIKESKESGDKLFSIPEQNGGFKMDRKSPDIAYYKIDKDGNVYLINEAGIKRAINNADSYLNKNLWMRKNLPDSEKHNGVIIKKTPKIDVITGSVIEKGELEFILENKIDYLPAEESANKKAKESIETPVVESKKEAQVENLVSLKEWSDFVERTTIAEHTINNIKEKVKNGKKLSEKEEAIRKYDELQQATGIANRAYTKAVYEQLGLSYSDSNAHRDIPIAEMEKTKFYKDNSDLITERLTGWDLTIDKIKSAVVHALYRNGKGWIQVDAKTNDSNIILAQIDLSLDENLNSLGKETEKAGQEFNDYYLYIKSLREEVKEEKGGERKEDVIIEEKIKKSGNVESVEDGEKGKQEKIDAVVEQFMQSILKTNELKRKLAEIVEQENSTEESGEEKETQNSPGDGEPVVEGKTETREQIIEEMNGLRKNYNNNTKEINKLRIELEDLHDEKDKLKIWQFKKIRNKNKEIEKKTKELHLCILEQEAQKEMFNGGDRKLFPFAYFVVDKIKNPTVRNMFEREALIVQKGVERKYLSLDYINNINDDFEIGNPIEVTNEHYPDGFYNSYFNGNNNINFNMYGFCIESLNPEEITENGHGWKVLTDKINGPNAKYKVLDNNGKIVIENVDYNNAFNSFKEATEKYKKQVEGEFNKLNNK